MKASCLHVRSLPSCKCIVLRVSIQKNPKTDFLLLFWIDQSKISQIMVHQRNQRMHSESGSFQLAPLMHYDLWNLWLTCLVKKHKIHIQILSDLRIQFWIFLKKCTLNYFLKWYKAVKLWCFDIFVALGASKLVFCSFLGSIRLNRDPRWACKWNIWLYLYYVIATGEKSSFAHFHIPIWMEDFILDTPLPFQRYVKIDWALTAFYF